MLKTPEIRFIKFLSKPDKNGCINWLGYKTSFGYGRFKLDTKSILAHRFSYRINIGPIINGFDVLHHCDNPSCVNHEHLYLGTDMDNSSDKRLRGRLPGGIKFRHACYVGHLNRKTSKLQGVGWDNVNKKWRAKITINGKCKHLGRFSSEREANRAYKKALERIC
jgi:hypothetical protein